MFDEFKIFRDTWLLYSGLCIQFAILMLSGVLQCLRTHCLKLTETTAVDAVHLNLQLEWVYQNTIPLYSVAIFIFRLNCNWGLFLELPLSPFVFYVVYSISFLWDISLMEIWEVVKKKKTEVVIGFNSQSPGGAWSLWPSHPNILLSEEDTLWCLSSL